MEKEHLDLESTYLCHSFLLGKAFLGKIIAIYENTCVIEVQSCDDEDTQKALEYNNRFVIPFKQLKTKIDNEKPAVSF